MGRAALRLVEAPIHEEREVELWRREDDEQGHSLHYVVSYPVAFPWTLPHYFITKYSQKGDVVLDPFCGTGTTLLEAGINGRIAVGADSDPLAVKIARAKLFPCDITEVTLRLQGLNLGRPAVLDRYQDHFSPFYEVGTFRELLGLRQALQEKPDQVAGFVEALALSLLHGHSAGYFSAYSYPQLALSPREQYALNLKRHQTPDYRSVAPRLLRKAAVVTADGLPAALRLKPSQHQVQVADPRNLHFVPTGSVSLIVTGVPYPGMRDLRAEQWLKVWFSGLEGQQSWIPSFDSIDEWRDYMNEVLFELARVTKSGGRAAFDMRLIDIDGDLHALDKELLQLVTNQLSRFWAPEVSLIQFADLPVTSIGTQRQAMRVQTRDYRVLVLRRR